MERLYLDLDRIPDYAYSSFRTFYPGEKHVTRVCREDVLVLILSGTLRFSENGRPVEVGANQYYIQKSGICQQGVLASDAPHYFYIHFLGHFSQTGGLPTAGTCFQAAIRDDTLPLFDGAQDAAGNAAALVNQSVCRADCP